MCMWNLLRIGFMALKFKGDVVWIYKRMTPACLYNKLTCKIMMPEVATKSALYFKKSVDAEEVCQYSVGQVTGSGWIQ